MGVALREVLRSRADMFRRPQLLTLTVKPSNFNGDPERAFRHVMDGRYISRLMGQLGVKRYVWVLELQKSGFPHWHLLVDAPFGRVDYDRAWKLWGWTRDAWQIGGVKFSDQTFDNPVHAVHYITKYIIKQPVQGYPDWVLNCHRRIRWVGASRAIGSLVFQPTLRDGDDDDDDDGEGDDEESRRAERRRPEVLRVRMLHCGDSVVFIVEEVIGGERRYAYMGGLPLEVYREVVPRVTGWPMDSGPNGGMPVLWWVEAAEEILQAGGGLSATWFRSRSRPSFRWKEESELTGPATTSEPDAVPHVSEKVA